MRRRREIDDEGEKCGHDLLVDPGLPLAPHYKMLGLSKKRQQIITKRRGIADQFADDSQYALDI